MNEIPLIIEELSSYWLLPPNENLWPEHLEDPVRGYGLYAFYRGLSLGLQLSKACQENT